MVETRRRVIAGIALVALPLLLLLVLPWAAGFAVDLAWFRALGHGDVLTTPLWTRLGLGVSAGALAFALVAANLTLAARLAKGRGKPLRLGEPERPFELDLGHVLSRLALPFAALIGLGFALSAAGHWAQWLMLAHAHPFGQSDPIHGRDIAFYVFTLPFLDAVYGWLLGITVVALLATAATYFLRGALGLGRKHGTARAVRVHLSVLGSLLMLVLAYGAWLSSMSVVLSDAGLVAGAGYADVHARLPMIRAQLAVALLAAALIGFAATRRRLVLYGVALGLYLAVGLLGRGLYPAMLQKYVVEPNELERERPYLEHEIASTRAAYALDGVELRELAGDPALSWAQIEDHSATLSNVRLWDHRPLLDTFGQIQEIRTYYDFVSVDNDRYRIDGALRQTMLSPRELSSRSLPNRTWINEHFTFTHGYGVTLGPVNEADGEGLPVLFVKDIPPASVPGAPEVARPQIYFGELTDEYVFVNATAREFDHPSGEGNVYASYEGSGGIALDGAMVRAALALDLGNPKILLSDDLSASTRVLMHRRILERVARLAPFLRFDHDPYMVIRDDGSLAWIVDAYTTTDRYPYARRDGAFAYIRNSVKAVIDAYDGSVDLYVNDEEDPILATWRDVFPGLMQPLASMPADLRAHLRYPLDIFGVQARMLATYHMDGPELLYNREDQWQVPGAQRGREGVEPMEPYYTVMRLPGEARPEFILMLPFTPARKDNLAAWMVARSDGPELGHLRVYELPNDRLVYGPQQVLNRINQDPTISQALSLWDQRGSEAHFGTLMVVPIEQSLLYVLPLYLRSEGGRIPQLKRVIVVHENHIAMAETLAGALEAVFGREPAPTEAGEHELAASASEPVEAPAASASAAEPPLPAPDTDPRVAALQHYDRAVAAQRRGDWAGYGEELEALERALRALQPERARSEPSEPTGPEEQAQPERAHPEQAQPEQAHPEQAQPEQAHPERAQP